MSIVRSVAVAAMLIAAPRPSAAQPAVLISVSMNVTVDSLSPATVDSARDAQSARRWNDAAQLWQAALLENPNASEHWDAYADALFNSGRYREAIGAYQRSMQLGARDRDDAVWNVARSFAHLGNRKQAMRWIEASLASGARTYRDVRQEPAFRSLDRDGTLTRRLARAQAFRHT